MEPQHIENGRAQVVYISHGGGPLPILGDPGHDSMVRFMEKLGKELEKPDAILVVSAHWEEAVPTVLGAEHPSMFYDYYGFPKAAYEITYPAPGDPVLAQNVKRLLNAAGFRATVDNSRGFDHGLFIPLKLMFPDADIPAIQLSLIRGLDAREHITLGKALSDLAVKKVLVIGSGFSFHNLGLLLSTLRGDKSYGKDPANEAFQDWLIDVCTDTTSQSVREQRLIQWESAPYARHCHPREEHLLPLHVCVGIADGPATVIFDDQIMGTRSVAFQW